MKFDVALGKHTATDNGDGTYTVRGGGWFWVKLSKDGSVLEMAYGMADKKAAKLFVSQAKLTIEKHFP